MELQRPWGVFEHTTETLPVLQNVGSRLGDFWKRTEMLSHLNLEWADERSWRRKVIFRSEDLSKKWPQEWLELAGSWALEGVLTLSDKSGKTWLWCHSGLTTLELGKSWGTSCLACCYAILASQARRTLRKVPLSCVEDFSVKWGLGTWGRYSRSTWVTLAPEAWGIPFFIS
jgi:hypothetical protein